MFFWVVYVKPKLEGFLPPKKDPGDVLLACHRDLGDSKMPKQHSRIKVRRFIKKS